MLRPIPFPSSHPPYNQSMELKLQVRQKGETTRAYQAYLDYRAMGVARSLRKLHETYTAPTLPAECPTQRLGTLENWSSKWGWQARIAEWEAGIQAEKEAAETQARLDERQRRVSLLDAMRDKINAEMPHARLSTDEGVKAFTALTRAFKAYMELSMKQYNDLPTEKQEVAQRAINVNFNTEPIPPDLVQQRLEALGLAHFVESQTE